MLFLIDSTYGSAVSLRYESLLTYDISSYSFEYKATGFFNDIPFIGYDDTNGSYPMTEWMKNEEQNFWSTNAQIFTTSYYTTKREGQTLSSRFELEEGIILLQTTYGCEILNGYVLKYYKKVYEGKGFILFNTEDEAEKQVNENGKNIVKYLTDACTYRLEKYLQHDLEVSPTVTITYEGKRDGYYLLTCRVDGFYPKDVQVLWTKDNLIWRKNISLGNIMPNSDKTFHTWIGVLVGRSEIFRYKCRVEHASLLTSIEIGAVGRSYWFIVSSLVCILILCLFGYMFL